MKDVLYIRPMDPPITPDALPGMIEYAGDCLDMHRVEWKKSFLTEEGDQMMCWYQGPDAESVRLALRTLGSNLNAVHAGGPFDLGEEARRSIDDATVLVDLPLAEDPDAQRSALARALEGQAEIEYIRGFEIAGGSRLIGLLRAESVESVREALDGAGLEPSAVWGGVVLSPPPAA